MIGSPCSILDAQAPCGNADWGEAAPAAAPARALPGCLAWTRSSTTQMRLWSLQSVAAPWAKRALRRRESVDRAVGLEWTVGGFGDFSGNAGESDMLMCNSNTGGFEVYDISSNAITSAGDAPTAS
jgi:hypothetical protein